MSNQYKVGDIFGLDDDYSNKANFCNDNGLMIVEIEKSEKGERRFQIQNVPPPNKIDLLYQELYEKKSLLEKYKEDVEQVELFEMERSDYNEKKKRCSNIVVRLREIEKEIKEYEQSQS